MKHVPLFAIAMFSLASLPLGSQQVDATARQNVSAAAAGVNAQESANSELNAQANQGGTQLKGGASGSLAGGAEMRPVSGELVGKLDTKTAKAGEQVVLKTTAATKTADGTVIPKGTRLVGHVTSVQARGSGSENSQMAIQFDKAELKGGQSLAIHSEIRSVAPPASAAMASSMEGEESFGGGIMGGGASAMGGARVNGAGRAIQGSVASTGSRTATGLGSTATGLRSTTNSTVRESGHIAETTSASAGGHANLPAGVATAGAAGHVTAQATGVRGVMLTNDASGRASGSLSATKQNVHLDSGTQMVLGISTAR